MAEWKTIPKASAAPQPEGTWKTIPKPAGSAPVVDISGDQPFLVGTGQGLTFRFGDEITAGLESLFSDKKYRDVWQRKQAELEALRQQFPGQMLSGEIAGSVAGAAIPGAAFARLGLGGARLAQGAVAANALQGALSGAGGSTTPGVGTLVDAAQGAAEGVIGGKIAQGAGKVTKAAWDKLKTPALRELARPVFGVPRKVAQDVLDSPETYAGPTVESIEEVIQNRALPLANRISQQVDEEKAAALQLLSKKVQAATPGEIGDELLQRMQRNEAVFADPVTGKLKNVVPGSVQKLKTTVARAEAKAGEKGYLTEMELADFRKAISGEAKYDSPSTSGLADSFKQLRGFMNERLKTNTYDESFSDAMKSVAEKTDDLEKLRKALSLAETKGPGGRYGYSDTTLNKLRTIANKEDSVAANAVDDFTRKYALSDVDLSALARRAKNEEALKFRSPGVRTMTGLASGNPLAALAGAGLDVAGGPAWKYLATKGRVPELSPFLQPAAVNLSTSPFIGEQYNPYSQ